MAKRKHPGYQHAYRNNVCVMCGEPASHTLPGMAEDVDRQEQAAAELSGEELTAKLREPLADISKKTGELERRSPLFFGTGENPGLFNQ